MPSDQLVVWGMKIGDKFGAQVAHHEGGLRDHPKDMVLADMDVLEREGILTTEMVRKLKEEGHRFVAYVVGEGKPYPAPELGQKRVGKEFGG